MKHGEKVLCLPVKSVCLRWWLSTSDVATFRGRTATNPPLRPGRTRHLNESFFYFHSKTKYFFDVISLAKKLPIKSAMIEIPYGGG